MHTIWLTFVCGHILLTVDPNTITNKARSADGVQSPNDCDKPVSSGKPYSSSVLGLRSESVLGCFTTLFDDAALVRSMY